MPVKSYKELIVWQRAVELVEEVYQLTKALPAGEQFGLISQLRRAVVSIPSNIAEGRKRGTRKDFVQFLRIADGSAAELETQLILAKTLYGIEYKKAEALIFEIQKMLSSMLRKLSASSLKL